jgi:hypothetical protein
LDALVAALPARFEQAQRADPALAREWLAATGLAGRRVRLETGGAWHAGTLAALDLDGLELESARGRERFPLELVQALARA